MLRKRDHVDPTMLNPIVKGQSPARPRTGNAEPRSAIRLVRGRAKVPLEREPVSDPSAEQL